VDCREGVLTHQYNFRSSGYTRAMEESPSILPESSEIAMDHTRWPSGLPLDQSSPRPQIPHPFPVLYPQGAAVTTPASQCPSDADEHEDWSESGTLWARVL